MGISNATVKEHTHTTEAFKFSIQKKDDCRIYGWWVLQQIATSEAFPGIGSNVLIHSKNYKFVVLLF